MDSSRGWRNWISSEVPGHWHAHLSHVLQHSLHGAEQPESQGQGHVLLGKKHSVGTSGQNKLPCRETQEQQGMHESSSYTLYHLYSTHTLSLATMPVSQSLGIIQKERAAWHAHDLSGNFHQNRLLVQFSFISIHFQKWQVPFTMVFSRYWMQIRKSEQIWIQFKFTYLNRHQYTETLTNT